MMIKCAKCNFENQLGGIFCRNCGEKLDIDSIRPKVVDQTGGFRIFTLLRKIITLAVLVLLIVVIAAMFIPTDVNQYLNFNDTSQQDEARAKFRSIMSRIDSGTGNERYVLTPAEASFLYNDTFLVKVEENASAYNIEKIVFAVNEQGFTKIIATTKLFGKIPSSFELKGSVVNTEAPVEGTIPVSFSIIECKMGKMPIKFVEQKVIEKFLPLLSDARVDKILRAAKKIEVNDEKNFVITLK